MIKAPQDWHVPYLGKPWAAIPQPPVSYTCGELVRAVHKDLFDLDSPPVAVPDASVLRDCLKAMTPYRYGLRPLIAGERPQTFDVAFFAKAKDADHCGVAYEARDGFLILHCSQRTGVSLDSLVELKSLWGFRRVLWWRHTDMDTVLKSKGWIDG